VYAHICCRGADADAVTQQRTNPSIRDEDNLTLPAKRSNDTSGRTPMADQQAQGCVSMRRGKRRTPTFQSVVSAPVGIALRIHSGFESTRELRLITNLVHGAT